VNALVGRAHLTPEQAHQVELAQQARDATYLEKARAVLTHTPWAHLVTLERAGEIKNLMMSKEAHSGSDLKLAYVCSERWPELLKFVPAANFSDGETLRLIAAARLNQPLQWGRTSYPESESR
jgi:hypothetical protein